MPALILYQAKTGHVRFSITDKNHIAEGHRTHIRWDILVHIIVLIDLMHALVDPKEVLGFRRVIQSKSRPRRDTVVIEAIG
jgi:hypothetical protein